MVFSNSVRKLKTSSLVANSIFFYSNLFSTFSLRILIKASAFFSPVLNFKQLIQFYFRNNPVIIYTEVKILFLKVIVIEYQFYL